MMILKEKEIDNERREHKKFDFQELHDYKDYYYYYYSPEVYFIENKIEF